jgi:uncharacterized protein
MVAIVDHPEGISFSVFIQPRSSKNVVVGKYGESLKIKLTAPPVDNAANKMCIQFLSKTLGVSKSSLDILSGHTGRKKNILVRLDRKGDFRKHAEELKRKLESLQ